MFHSRCLRGGKGPHLVKKISVPFFKARSAWRHVPDVTDKFVPRQMDRQLLTEEPVAVLPSNERRLDQQERQQPPTPLSKDDILTLSEGPEPKNGNTNNNNGGGVRAELQQSPPQRTAQQQELEDEEEFMKPKAIEKKDKKSKKAEERRRQKEAKKAAAAAAAEQGGQDQRKYIPGMEGSVRPEEPVTADNNNKHLEDQYEEQQKEAYSRLQVREGLIGSRSSLDQAHAVWHMNSHNCKLNPPAIKYYQASAVPLFCDSKWLFPSLF